MIGVDTSVLVRVFVPDSAAETRAALDFLAHRSNEDPAYVTAVVVVELVWVLKRSYGFSARAIFAALDTLFESANVEIEKPEVIQSAIATAQMERADVADCIIAAAAAQVGASKTMTFDKIAARRIPSMELLK